MEKEICQNAEINLKNNNNNKKLHLISFLQVFPFFGCLSVSHHVLQAHMLQDGPENTVMLMTQ